MGAPAFSRASIILAISEENRSRPSVFSVSISIFYILLHSLSFGVAVPSKMPPRPRGRPRRRDTRMDAALDAMRQFEFDPGLVRKTVKELLDVYDGEVGWPFIEEYAYKLLIETIIEKDEAKKAEAKNKGDSPRDNASPHVNSTPTTEPQSEVAPADCSNMQMSNTASQTNEQVDTVPSQTNEARESASLGSEVHDPSSQNNKAHDHASPATESVVKLSLPPRAEDTGVVSESLNLEQNIQTEQLHTSLENHNVASGTMEHPSTAPAPPYKLSFPELMDGFAHGKVRPCHGWIDGDEELDLVELTPPPLPERLRRMLDRVDGLFTLYNKKKRKSRWDVRPEDTM